MTTALLSAPRHIPSFPAPRPWAPEPVPGVIAALLPRPSEETPDAAAPARRAAEIAAYPWRLRWRDAVQGPDTPAPRQG